MPTPPDAERPHAGPVLEPVRVLRPRRLDALAELMREMEAVVPAQAAQTTEDDTQELPPVPPARPTPGMPGRKPGVRRAALAGAVAVAALVGFGCALLLPDGQEAAATARPSTPVTTAPPAATPTPTPSAAGTSATDPDGAGTLRQGDTGPEVTELQQRLLRIPDVYRDGSTNGTYDATLTAAVARFQLWYGIRGDETGVYGNDTRHALESRTTPGDGS
ncbi:peptidoglycan-binding protein [Streptomyces sp. NPDC020192]|uniref:peptidoglycan-binding protein n=1 Tax=Streptomyces sp. NPDC020192 TaxID=3365066 RepID=UPI0037AB4B0A